MASIFNSLVVTKATAAGGDADDLVSEFYTHFQSSGLFTPKSGVSNSADAFVLGCNKSGEDWEVCIRRSGTSDIIISMAPDGDYTDAGDASTAPTVSDAGNFSGEITISLAATRASDLYIVELDDAFFILLMNSAKTQIAEAWHIGRVYDSIKYRRPVDEVGILAGYLDFSSSSTAGFWLSTAAESLLYINAGKWVTPSGSVISGAFYGSDGAREPAPVIGQFTNLSGANDRPHAFYLRYVDIAPESSTRPPGDTEDGTDDHFLYVESNTTGNTRFLIPWDNTVADFA